MSIGAGIESCGIHCDVTASKKLQQHMDSNIFQALPASPAALQDAFHDVSDVRPFHLPHIFEPTPGSACAAPGPDCRMNSTTVTMPIYDLKAGWEQ